MRITIEDHEIEAALDAYVRGQIAMQPGQTLTTRLAMDPTSGRIEASVLLGQPGGTKPMLSGIRSEGETARTPGTRRPRGSRTETASPENAETAQPTDHQPQSDATEAETDRAITASPEDRQPRNSIFAGLKAVPKADEEATERTANEEPGSDETPDAGHPTDTAPTPEPQPVEPPAQKPKSIFSFGPKPAAAAGA